MPTIHIFIMPGSKDRRRKVREVLENIISVVDGKFVRKNSNDVSFVIPEWGWVDIAPLVVSALNDLSGEMHFTYFFDVVNT